MTYLLAFDDKPDDVSVALRQVSVEIFSDDEAEKAAEEGGAVIKVSSKQLDLSEVKEADGCSEVTANAVEMTVSVVGQAVEDDVRVVTELAPGQGDS